MPRLTLVLLLLTAPAFAGVDTDGDHLSDAREAVAGTDPLVWDTDGDSVPDGAEMDLFGTDPLFDETPACAPWAPNQVTAQPRNPIGMTVGDLDADGDLDIVASSQKDGVLGWYANDGSGGYGARQAVAPAAAYAADDLVLADLDGDGDPDLVYASGGSDEIGWYPNLGAGVFGLSQLISASQDLPTTVALADLDADGDLDLLAGSGFDHELAWYENLGGGVFGPAILLSVQGDDVTSVGAADLDGDGDLDAFSTAWNDEVSWHENLGGGVFAARTVITSAIATPTSVAAADVDADGDLDLVVGAIQDGSVIENLGGGAFALGGALGAGFVYDLGVADLDGDGDPDFAVAGTYGIHWFENVGGDPGPAREAEGRSGAIFRLALGDADGDGDDDIVSGSSDALDWLANNNFLGRHDDDLLTDEAELCITGTDPAADDTDGGGTPDGEEVLAFDDPRDPTDDQPSLDTDADGLPDLVERFVDLTDPLNADSDGDGLPDADEIAAGTDALVADTDGDGVADGAERLLLGTDPFADDAAACGGVEHPMTSDPDMVDVADVDGDGDLDVIGGDNFAPYVRWWSNLGGGTLSAQIAIGALATTTRVRAIDFDQDGDPDIAYCSLYADQIGWFENLGGGSFSAARVISVTQDFPYDTVGADVDGDGDLDLVAISVDDDTVSWYEFTAGSFGPENAIATVGGLTDLLATDLDRDGDPDIVVTDQSIPAYQWYQNLGGGAFALAGVVPSGAPGFLTQPRAADADGDGDVDLFGGGSDEALAWYENLGGQAFGPEQVIVANLGANDLVLADFDGDADPDIAISATSSLYRYENLGGGQFGPGVIADSDGNLNGVTAGDMDGDGDLDLVWMGYSGTGWVSNTWSDLDRDGLPEATETCMTTTDPLAADTDGGGTADGRELLDLTDPLFAGDDILRLALVPPDPPVGQAMNTFTVEGATPGGRVLVVRSGVSAPSAVPGCPGLTLDLAAPVEVARALADAAGTALPVGTLPAPGRTAWFQALDRTGCVVSDPIALTME
jgi:hypothetical protein